MEIEIESFKSYHVKKKQNLLGAMEMVVMHGFSKYWPAQGSKLVLQQAVLEIFKRFLPMPEKCERRQSLPLLLPKQRMKQVDDGKRRRADSKRNLSVTW